MALHSKWCEPMHRWRHCKMVHRLVRVQVRLFATILERRRRACLQLGTYPCFRRLFYSHLLVTANCEYRFSFRLLAALVVMYMMVDVSVHDTLVPRRLHRFLRTTLALIVWPWEASVDLSSRPWNQGRVCELCLHHLLFLLQKLQSTASFLQPCSLLLFHLLHLLLLLHFDLCQSIVLLLLLPCILGLFPLKPCLQVSHLLLSSFLLSLFKLHVLGPQLLGLLHLPLLMLFLVIHLPLQYALDLGSSLALHIIQHFLHFRIGHVLQAHGLRLFKVSR
mmetsp:Transcript_45601/g.102338  ORF Transcript_45601/g.102338 Transcript_45601/m.102338 type:complete len:277 (-) Transcript_45601:853-1683(-)